MNIELFLAIVNKVTAFHRHGQHIPKAALDRLSNAQIELEAELKTEEGQKQSANKSMAEMAWVREAFKIAMKNSIDNNYREMWRTRKNAVLWALRHR